MNSATLYYRAGSSDKIYQCTIAPQAGLYVVNFAYGRRGSTLNTGTKTTTPVALSTAQSIFDKLVKEKTAKGYTRAENGTPYEHSDQASQVSGFLPQLLNPVDEDELAGLLNDHLHWAQEKHDGRRLLLQKHGAAIHGINRKGLIVGLPSSLVQAAHSIPGDFVLDGEAINETLQAFDLLQVKDEDLRSQSYHYRYVELMNLLASAQQTSIKLVESAIQPADKQRLLQRLRSENKEGIVYKRSAAPYVAGRPNSGGTQFKHKFYATGSFLVQQINSQRSVSLSLVDRSQPLGNVTIPPNHAIPLVGAVVEVRYLYAYPEGGCLFQPIYLGERDDLDPSACTLSQLKYKANNSDDDL